MSYLVGMQADLFADPSVGLTRLPMEDSQVWFQADFLSAKQADQYFACLLDSLTWRQDDITVFGRKVSIPRLQAWHGDVRADYSYSGLNMQPNPWTPALAELRDRCARACQCQFNSVLANYYRNGSDSMGWHSDDEPELGAKPVIASLTLGQTRDFDFRHKISARKVRLVLSHGSLLVMAGTTQQYWQHAIPKRRRQMKGRINLTFRLTLPSEKKL